ncbi:MAG: bifunctional precorrin-2 dehydrogenase/sirohydrochlorin ferrochelatase [Nitrospirae bacterium]|nr:bifunctional precorrin-2 dehydrogenase/sirohydrochlorin ferrochelatase [Nitrospirota bacterium]
MASEVYYPAFLNLKGKRAVVIGGGKVAERKILALLRAGADVTVISPKLTKRLEKEKAEGRIRHIPREYRRGDLKGAFLVIAATSYPEINTKVVREAGVICESLLLNVVDMPSQCNFIVPSIVRRGPLTIAISTSGTSPAMARAIRRDLEKLYGPEFANYLKLLGKIRKKAIKEVPDKKKRAEFFKSLASEEMMEILRNHGFKETSRAAEDLYRGIQI